MKKIIALVMAAVMCLSFVGCLKLPSFSYSEKDFLIYSKDGKVLERPTAENEEISLEFVEDGVTSRGVAIGDDAIEALKKYDLCYGKSVYSAGNDDDEEIKTLSEDVDLEALIKKSNFLMLVLTLDKDYNPTNTMELILNNKTPTYMIAFYIAGGKITDVMLSNNNIEEDQDSADKEEKEDSSENEDVSSSEDVSDFEDTSSSKDFDEESVKKKLVINTYSFNKRYSNYGFLEITNNSKFDLEISVDVKFYDASGNLIGAKSNSEDAFQQGTTILLRFSADEEFSSMEYEVSVDEETYYECIVKDLSYESVAAKNKEIVTVTNNGTETAEWVVGTMLFFNGDQVVDYDYTYFEDSDGELKPGKSVTEEISCYEEYDSYKFYLTGYKY